MKKIILDLAVTLDGFIEGPHGEIDWCIMDEDGGSDFIDFVAGIDTIFYGRVSYELWGNYQPDENESPIVKEVYKSIAGKTQYVFSTTKTNDNSHAIFINSNIKERVMEMKQQPGKDIWLYGGAKLITTFINLGLVDILRLVVHPVILGSGKPLFKDIKERVGLKLTRAKASKSGVVLLNIYIFRSRGLQPWIFILSHHAATYKNDYTPISSLSRVVRVAGTIPFPTFVFRFIFPES